MKGREPIVLASQPGAPSSPALSTQATGCDSQSGNGPGHTESHMASPNVRFWSVEEARAYLPRLRELVDLIKRAAGAQAKVRSNGHAQPPGGVEDALAELAAGDIIVRDPHTGLVDFHALGGDGVVYLLCWKLGEDELEWWHLPDAGFAGRRRLPRDAP